MAAATVIIPVVGWSVVAIAVVTGTCSEGISIGCWWTDTGESWWSGTVGIA